MRHNEVQRRDQISSRELQQIMRMHESAKRKREKEGGGKEGGMVGESRRFRD